MKALIKSVKYAAVGCLMALPSFAAPIYLLGDSNVFTTQEDNEVFFQNVFNGKSVVNFASNSLSGLGTTATETNLGVATAITASNLGTHDFMIFGYNRTSVSAGELTAITDYYNAGGSLFLYGEGNSGFTALNKAVNEILAAVGSSMSLSTTQNLDDGSFTTLTGLVTNGPDAAGVNSWTTAYTSLINVGSGTAVISGVADNGTFGAAVALENGVAPIPVPAALPLLLVALGGLGFVGRRRKTA